MEVNNKDWSRNVPNNENESTTDTYHMINLKVIMLKVGKQ